MEVHAIGGQEFQFDHYCRRYRKFMRLNFGRILLWLCCVDFMLLTLFYDSLKNVVTLILCLSVYLMLLQRSVVTLLLWFSVYFLLLQRSVVTLILWLSVYFMICCCYAYNFILWFYKVTFLRYSYTSTRKNIFNGIITISNFGNHNNMLC